MPRRYDIYHGSRKVGEAWEKPDWEGEIVGFILSWIFYLVAMAFVLVFRGVRAMFRRG